MNVARLYLCEVPRTIIFIEDRSRFQGLGRQMGELVFLGGQSFSLRDENALRMDVVMVAQGDGLHATELHT